MTGTKLILIFLLFFILSDVTGQTPVDTSAQISLSDSLEIVELFQVSEQYFTNPDSGFYYINQGLTMSNRTRHFSETLRGLILKSELNRSIGQYDSATNSMEEALSVIEKHDLQGYLHLIYIEYGHVSRLQGLYEQAISFYQKVFEINQKHDDKWGMAGTMNDIGNIYLDQYDFTRALEYYHKAEDLHEDGSLEQTRVYYNISVVHYRLKDFEKFTYYAEIGSELAIKHDEKALLGGFLKQSGMVNRTQGNYSEALKYYALSIENFKALGSNDMVAQVYSNMGNVYYDMEEFDNALAQYDLAYEIQNKLNSKDDICFTLLAMGGANINLKRYTIAEEQILRVLDLAKIMKSSLVVMDAYRYLSELYEKTGNYKKAYKNHVAYKSMADSLFNVRKSEQIAEMETRFKTESKEKEIDLLNAQNEINLLQISTAETQKTYLIMLAVMIFLSILILFNRYKIKVKANRKLKDLDRFKSRFFANISHEFRTPLTLILSPIEGIIKEETDSSKQAVFKRMQKNAERLLELINQLLDLSKLDAGSLRLEVSKSDINLFLSSLSHSFESLADQKEIKYLIEIPSSEFIIQFDKDKIQKIVTNLLSNAFKFTSANGQVLIKTTVLKESYKIEVSDTGCGIPSDQLKIIFDRFHQISSNDDKHGTGIGLALTKELTELHKGQIEVKSEVNNGSEFIVIIPTDIAERETIPVENMVLPPSDSFVKTQQIEELEEQITEDRSIVLLIEDNEEVRKYIKSIFISTHVILEAENGSVGYDFAVESIPDIVICDLMMPVMDGIEFCERMKLNQLTSHIPIILLTARADFDSKMQGLQTGADEYLVKPFKEEELKLRVTKLTEQRKKLRERYSETIFLEPTSIDITPPDKIFMKKAQEVVETNIPNLEFTVEQFCKEVGVSRMQLHRKLKALINCSARDFIRDQRLLRSAQLLSQEGVNVSETAYLSGFNNVSYFAKCFKEKYGVLPSDFRSKT